MVNIKNIKGYEGKYLVTRDGRVITMSRVIGYNHSMTGKRLTRRTKAKEMSIGDCKGYNTLGLSKDGVTKSHRLCRIVALHFVPNPENKPAVNHKDGNKKNDHADNLEWVTAKENSQHAFRTGLMTIKTGADRHNSLSVKCIKTGRIYDTVFDAAKDNNISAPQLSRVLRGVYKNRTTLRLYKPKDDD